jgi:predicted ArsR family transcriptional regulator
VRAGRLVELLSLLQTRGRLTAAQLAAELEVSQRTILRDIEELSAAGFPVMLSAAAVAGSSCSGDPAWIWPSPARNARLGRAAAPACGRGFASPRAAGSSQL